MKRLLKIVIPYYPTSNQKTKNWTPHIIFYMDLKIAWNPATDERRSFGTRPVRGWSCTRNAESGRSRFCTTSWRFSQLTAWCALRSTSLATLWENVNTAWGNSICLKVQKPKIPIDSHHHSLWRLHEFENRTGWSQEMSFYLLRRPRSPKQMNNLYVWPCARTCSRADYRCYTYPEPRFSKVSRWTSSHPHLMQNQDLGQFKLATIYKWICN